MTNFNFDKVHSSLEFTVKHLMVSRVKGTFDDYDVEVTGDVNDLSSLKAKVTIKAHSINTNNPDRDAHLKSADFFSAEENPNITFESKSISEYSVTGDLTIAGTTHEETFDLEFNGVSKNPLNGETVTGFVVDGKIDREKYGVSFNQALETGGVMIGKDVKFEASAEFSLGE
ncbi:YceI family protein [Mammaliicoccus sp. JADD-157]|uniref:YceI family protein n=1 Tax=Mammaliicoccus sp. JADD-157 TaxID=3404818 RepID=UPI003BB7BA73